MFMEIHEQYKGLVYFDNFLSDDDSTTRATLSLTSVNTKGKLPEECKYQPTFWADVNHRIKCMVKPLFALSGVPDSISECTMNDCLRIKRNFGWYFQTARKGDITLDEFLSNCKAPVAHHFHNHEWCSATWCPFKNWDEKE